MFRFFSISPFAVPAVLIHRKKSFLTAFGLLQGRFGTDDDVRTLGPGTLPPSIKAARLSELRANLGREHRKFLGVG